MSRKSRSSPSVAPGRGVKKGKRWMPVLRASPLRSASWFVPVGRSSKTDRPARSFKPNDGMDPTLLDEMALINATPLGVDEVTVPVGIEGLQQDWYRVGQMLRNAMGAVSEDEPPEVSKADQGKH